MKPSISTILLAAATTMASIASATEAIYLADCITVTTFPDQTTATDLQSSMVYYSDITQSQHQEVPDWHNVANLGGNPHGDHFTTWEEKYIEAKFYDGNHVKAYINADAAHWPVGTVSGNAVNDNGKWFTCIKAIDNFGLLFEKKQSNAIRTQDQRCFKRYVCTA
ncbi:hypothetical protein HDU97_003764 [Phlyctochytrium planicorne]|nr:hypothetical protein HDU97_003764 [Phlyctochytrium planicorne]